MDVLDNVPVLETFDIKKNDKASYAAVISGLCLREIVEEIVEVPLCPDPAVAQLHHRPPQRMRRFTWSGPPPPTYNNRNGERLVSILPVRESPSSELLVTNV
jgi:hypothetical protein